MSFFVLFCPFLSFLGLSRFSRDFPDLLGDGSGIFPICHFPLSRPTKSTYEEQSRKGPRHNLDLSRKSGKHPGLETPRFSFSQKNWQKVQQRPLAISLQGSLRVFSGTKPKDEVLGQMCLRTSGQIIQSGSPPAFWHGHPAWTSMTKLRSENLGLILRSHVMSHLW